MKAKSIKNDRYFMLQALEEAYKVQHNEVPIGAIIVIDNKVIARGANMCITLSDPTAHAEIIVLRKAAKKLSNYRLKDCSVYVTIEPCAMCAGALVNARIKKIIFGAFDVKAGACGSVFKIANNKKLNHRVQTAGGEKKYLSEECASLIQNFFKEKRVENKKYKLIGGEQGSTKVIDVTTAGRRWSMAP